LSTLFEQRISYISETHQNTEELPRTCQTRPGTRISEPITDILSLNRLFLRKTKIEAVKPALVKNCGIVTLIDHPIGDAVRPKRKIDLEWKILDQLLRTKVPGKSFGQSKLLLWKGFVCIEMSLETRVPPYHTDRYSRHSPGLWACRCSPDPEGKLACCTCRCSHCGFSVRL